MMLIPVCEKGFLNVIFINLINISKSPIDYILNSLHLYFTEANEPGTENGEKLFFGMQCMSLTNL